MDGQPLPPSGSGALTGWPFSLTWDTHNATDGTHIFYCRVIDTLTTADAASNFIPQSLIAIIANSGFNNGTQVVPVASRAVTGEFSPAPPTVDFVTYGGTPYPHNTSYPNRPGVFIPPATSDPRYATSMGGDPTLLRNAANWYSDQTNEPNNEEYQTTAEFSTTLQGGVFVQMYNPDNGIQLTDAYPTVVRNNPFQGGRLDSRLTPYVNYVPAPDGSGWYGAEVQGRIVRIDNDGTVTTVYGWERDRTQLNIDMYIAPAAYPESSIRRVFVGTTDGSFSDIGGANDLCFDPRDTRGPGGTSATLYVAVTMDNWICQIDLLASGTPHGIRYAGTVDTPGYVDGSALSAQFNFPHSIIMADGTGNGGPAGTMYVADLNNGYIRKIAPGAGLGSPGGTVSTLVGKGNVGEAVYVPAVDGNPDGNIYAPIGSQPFTSCYTELPACIRFTSNRNIVLSEQANLSIRLIDLGAQKITRIGIFEQSFGTLATSAYTLWTWLDVDSKGTCGPVDDIITLKGTGRSAQDYYRISLDGSYSQVFENGDWHLREASAGYTVLGMGHYSWAFAFGNKQGRMISYGFQNVAPFITRILQPGDPTTVGFANVDYYGLAAGNNAWDLGTSLYFDANQRLIYQFPWGSRPPFISLRGQSGVQHMGCFPGANTTEEIFAKFTTIGDFDSFHPNDGTLTGYIQGGMGGTVPRPELTGNPLRYMFHYMQRNTPHGSYPTPVTVPPLYPDNTPPVISNLTVTRLSPTSIRFTWNTNKPTIGYAMAGSANQQAFVPASMPYNIFSPIEGNYGTSHNVTITGLPKSSPIHYSVLSKDFSGNSAYTADASLA
jgi:hypothetical protein